MTHDIAPYIRAFKSRLDRPALAASFATLQDAVSGEIDSLQDEITKGGTGIPELPFADIANGRVSEDMRAAVRKKGCAIIRGVFPRAQATGWNDGLGD